VHVEQVHLGGGKHRVVAVGGEVGQDFSAEAVGKAGTGGWQAVEPVELHFGLDVELEVGAGGLESHHFSCICTYSGSKQASKLLDSTDLWETLITKVDFPFDWSLFLVNGERT